MPEHQSPSGTVPHPDPCIRPEDACPPGTHYCEQMPCVMEDDVMWPCQYATPQSGHSENDPLCQCAGCGEYRSISWLGKPHNCHRNEDGTYEEGGTFQ